MMVYNIRSVEFASPREIFNKGALSKIASGMEGLEIVESDEAMKPGIFIYNTDPRAPGRIWVPVFQIGAVRYDEEEVKDEE